MCRFVAYLGDRPMVVGDIINKPKHALIKQSRHAHEGELLFHPDGFGLGWYNQAIDNSPAVFKSISPAWRNENLQQLASKLLVNCFVAHVRSSTVGKVSELNCHPFQYKNYLFAHNGTITQFSNIRSKIYKTIPDHYLNLINGQTDSEHFFALFLYELEKNFKRINLTAIQEAFRISIDRINYLQKRYNHDSVSRLNFVLTDGRKMIVCRYISRPKPAPITLYYCSDQTEIEPKTSELFDALVSDNKFVLFTSEKLTPVAAEWHKIPPNHFVLVDEHIKISHELVY